jgi:transposase
MKHQDGRKLQPEAQEAIRLRVAHFLKTAKGTQQQAADIFQLSVPAVKKIWKQYKEGGMKSLKLKKRGPHQCTALLSKQQVKQLKSLIKKDMPDSYHIPYYLWTADAVRLLIKKKQG